MDRDFKGVWIPKEIWLDKELDLTEKALLIEIHSLDNDFHCVASNEYFANFLNCSESTITRAIKHLKDLGFIESDFDGRVRKLRVVKLTRQSSQIDEHNNITNNIYNKENTKVFSQPPAVVQETLLEDTSNIPKKPKKKNLYAQCMDLIDEFTEDEEVRDKLKDYLGIRLERKDTPLGIKSFKGMLKKLRELTDSKEECLKIIQQSIDRSYLSFFPVREYKSYGKKLGKDVETITKGDTYSVSQEEKEELRRLVESGELKEY